MKHKWHKEIKAWADGAEIEFLTEDGWFNAGDPEWNEDSEYRIKPPAKCITKDCTNHVNEGKFVGDLCAPCWDYIINGKGVHSQAYRNAQPKEPQYVYLYGVGYERQIHLTSPIGMPKSYVYLGKIKLEVDDVWATIPG